MAGKREFTEIKRFESDLEQCMKCGFCTFWCPVYQEERVESSVARGKNLMVRGLLAGDLEYTKEFAARLNKCTLCMTCTANCPAKANIPNVIVAARADTVRARGVKFPYNIVYRWLLPRRTLFGNVVRFASWFQGVFLPRTEGTIRHLAMFLSALGKGRNIPQIAPRFLRQIVPVVNKPPAGVETRMKVGYFTGCMTDFVFPELGEHIIDFLTRNGVEVVVPKEQGCCGAPAFLGAGDFDTGRKLADTNIKAFEDVDYIVSDCATCTSSLKDYAKYLADTPERKEAYARFGEKVYDISQFLVDVLKLPASAYKAAPEVKGKKVTWHDPCHLVRHLGIKDQPRQIINSIPDVEYIEMPNADRCCGMAGTFSVYYYDLSKKIADKKVESIKSTGADIVVSSCPGCEIQLIDSTIRNKLPVKVMHIMELLQ
ncbi:MAG: (Fe-S)-binding protein [Chloroflexota bacterium]|nr:(Fe-S)-binding protein [Chloroflexota bacterium]